ncbi:ABC transporter ATP-binding protein [Paenibacillus albidus]|uniref:ABC transporter ATP-binding protein n=1 Tax=Paenibacillus albidus TaxID=2041023 RepID=A0A917CRD0_9BACL|nr:ABC transporter ATP-binding protein [Paenibacillus albidus]GGF94587.1 ABC transporter ATP-binding protein [Paenibacillus albidus]
MQPNLFDTSLRLLFSKSIKFLKPYKLRFLFSIICLVSGVGISLIEPLIWGKLLTGLFSKDYQHIIKLIVYIIIIYSLQIILNYVQTFLFSYLNENIIYDLKESIFRKIMNLQVSAFEDIGQGGFLSRLHEDTATISNLITQEFINISLDILKVVFVGIIAFAISPTLAFITIISFPLTYYINLKFGKLLKEKNTTTMNVYDEYFSVVQESLAGIKEIKALGVKKERVNLFLELSSRIKKLNIDMNILSTLAGNISLIVNYTTQIVLYSVGAYLIFKENLKVEYFIAFTSYSQQFLRSLSNLTKINLSLRKAGVSLQRVYDLIDHKSVEEFGDLDIDSLEGEIKFENVNFNYEKQNTVLQNLNLDINPGKKYAMVGLNGAGKSTIFNLITRFNDPLTGKITIDGIDIKELNEISLRKNIAVVRQEPTLFNLTIKENLLLANPQSSMRDIINACEKVNIHEFINTLPERYNTKLLNSARNLSGGQRQSIAFARAILKRSKIILFDEATSALDNDSQFSTKKIINELSNDHLVIIIAHRLLNIIDADEIMVVNNGQIVNQGTHEYLMKVDSLYQRLYKEELDFMKNR